VAAVRAAYEDRILPGTSVAGVDVGGRSEAEARAALSPVLGADDLLTLAAGGRRLRVRPSAAGYAADVEATLARAMASGRSGPLGGTWATVRGLVEARPVRPVASIDPEALARTVARLERRIERRPFAGALRISRRTLEVRTRAPVAGSAVDRRVLAARLREALLDRPAGRIRIPVRRTPAPSPEAVSAVAEDARSVLRRPFVVGRRAAGLRVPPREMAEVLALRRTGSGTTGVRLGTRPEALARLVEGLAERHDRSPRDAAIRAPGDGPVVDGKGAVSWAPRRADVGVRPAREGRKLLGRATAASIDAAIRAGRRRAALRARSVAPAVTTAAARRVRFLAGTFTTRYEPGQPRVTNIRRIARAVDGTVVAPGAQFSLNRTAGPRTAARGYVPAPFIADGRIVPSVGGGVSQFSTTLYNAAYFAGLRLERHQPHSLFIDRYPAGREATLNFPDIDLVWTNDTEAPVLIRATTDATSVTVRLYGAGGRRVSAEPGPRRPVEGGDFAITVTRVVRYADGRTTRQAVTTRYDTPAPDS
jgi:vancomycin resistance protein YoaR